MNSSIEKWRGYAWDLLSGTIVEKKNKLWWACLDLNQSPFTPLEYVLPGVVKDMRQAIAEDDFDCFERLCSLLESLGGMK